MTCHSSTIEPASADDNVAIRNAAPSRHFDIVTYIMEELDPKYEIDQSIGHQALSLF